VLQGVAGCVAVRCIVSQFTSFKVDLHIDIVAVYCSVLQYVAVCYSTHSCMQIIVAVYCSVLQYVAVCYSTHSCMQICKLTDTK